MNGRVDAGLNPAVTQHHEIGLKGLSFGPLT